MMRKKPFWPLPLLLCLCLLIPGEAMASCSVCPCACASGSSCGGGLSCPSNAPAPAPATGGAPATGIEPGYNPNTPYANFPNKKQNGYLLERPDRTTGCIYIDLIPLYGGALCTADGQQVLFAQSVLKDGFYGTTLLLTHRDPEAALSLYLDISTVIWLLDKGFDTVAFQAGADGAITHLNLEDLLLTLAFGGMGPIIAVETRLDALEKSLGKPLMELTEEDLANIPQAQIDALTQAFIAAYGPITAFDGHPGLADSNITPEFWLALLSRQEPGLFRAFLSSENGEQAQQTLAYWETLISALDFDTEAFAKAYPGVDASTTTSKLDLLALILKEEARSEYATTDRHESQADRAMMSFLIPAGTTWISTANILTSEGLSGTAAEIAKAARAAAFSGTLDEQEEQRYGITVDSQTNQISMVVYPEGPSGAGYLLEADPDTGDLVFVDSFTGQRITSDSPDYAALQAFYEGLFAEE